MSDLDVRTLYGGGRWCRRRMRGADGDERRRRMKDIPTGNLGPAGSRISFVYIEVPYSCTNKKSSNQSSKLFDNVQVRANFVFTECHRGFGVN